MSPGLPILLSPDIFTPSDIRRFWSKVNMLAGPRACWPWTAGRDKDGFGKFQIGPNGRQRHLRAHRVALALSSGVATRSGLHTCVNPPCCNPAHLFDGTQADSRREPACGDRNGRRTHPERTPIGERHWNAQLTADLVRQIREVSRPVYGDRVRVARRFGVSVNAVRLVLAGRTWRHVLAEAS